LLLERTGLPLGIVTLGARTFQALLVVAGVELAACGGLVQSQALWLVATLGMLGLGSALALGTAQSTVAAVLTGLLWLGQTRMRHLLIGGPWAQPLFHFAGFFTPGEPPTNVNLSLLGRPGQPTHCAAAAGRSCAPTGNKPDHGLIVVSTQHLEDGIQYRVVGDLAPGEASAVPVPPSLEDGYMALMRGRLAGA